jgi:predicted nucleic acid-binding protein
LIENEEDLSLCGVVLAEVLQGIRSDTDFIKTKDYFGDLIFLPMRHATFLRAAEMYRSIRKKGITIRKPIDCMIASVAIEYDIHLLHNDRDFIHIAKHSKLRVCD